MSLSRPDPATGSAYSVAIVNSHPIQYFAPLYRRIAAENDIDLKVYYCSRKGLVSYVDGGFSTEVEWDIPLLEGYDHRFLRNVPLRRKPEGLLGLVNPDIVAEIIRSEYDAVWVHGYRAATNLMAIAVAKIAGTSVFMRGETHSKLDRPPWKRVVRRAVLGALYRACDGLLSIGTRNREFYQSLGVADTKIFDVPYTVDNEYFRKVSEPARRYRDVYRRKLGLPTEKPLVLFASKFIARKRPKDLLLAFQRIRDRVDEAGLVMVGDGPLMEEVKNCAQRRRMRDVRFLGFRNQSELPAIFGCSDIFVLPSENEPWGLVINEAMAAGLPVITTDEVGAAADLVLDGRNGYCYETGDVNALADRLERLVSNRSLRESMAERSRRIIEHWSYDECVEGLRLALSSVADDSSSKGALTGWWKRRR